MKVVPPGPTTIKGIDVSKWQGAIAWARLPKDTAFAFVRCSDGIDHPDPRFAENWRAAKEHGLIRGVYQYLRPDVDVREQVELMAEMIREAGGLEAGDLPPAVDVEAFGNEDCTPEQFRAATAEWIQLCEELLERRPIVYTGPSVQDANDLGSVEGITDYPLWVAHYTDRPGPWIAEPWEGWQMWQYTGEGQIAGIQGDVDLDLFNGSRDDLKQLVARSRLAAVIEPDPDPPAPPAPEKPMSTLVYLIHADPSQNAKYVAAAREAGHEIELINVTLGNGSSVYRRLARDVRTLDGFMKRYPPKRPHDALVIATFSAGYGFPAELLELDPTAADQIDAMAFLDSHHAGLDPDGTAKDLDLAGLVSFAELATGPKVCWVGHSDVPTVGYASTTQVANELARLTGLEFVRQQTVNRQQAVRIAESGGLRIEGYNLVGPEGTEHSWTQAQLEHGLALTKWGPPFLARALVELAGRRDAPPAPEPPEDTLDTELSHGERIVAWALARVGTAEQPLGSNRGPEVSAWLKPCQRDGYGPEFGRWLASSGANWCLGFACAAAYATRLSDDPPHVHGYRASGIEAERDAKACGAWRDINEVRVGTWRPEPGDIALYQSGDGTAANRWRRHGVLVIADEGESYRGVGGNEGHKVTDQAGRRYDHALLLGFIARPQPDEPMDVEPLRRAAALDALGWEFKDGMAAFNDAFAVQLAELEKADPRDDGEDVVG
jgi:GH25 family lysozyme M1 (1,4-beta-N-acetylmuramidase)